MSVRIYRDVDIPNDNVEVNTLKIEVLDKVLELSHYKGLFKFKDIEKFLYNNKIYPFGRSTKIVSYFSYYKNWEYINEVFYACCKMKKIDPRLYNTKVIYDNKHAVRYGKMANKYPRWFLFSKLGGKSKRIGLWGHPFVLFLYLKHLNCGIYPKVRDALIKEKYVSWEELVELSYIMFFEP